VCFGPQSIIEVGPVSLGIGKIKAELEQVKGDQVFEFRPVPG
jgi:hypothetical protein